MRTSLLLISLSLPALGQAPETLTLSQFGANDQATWALTVWHTEANSRCRGGSGDRQATWQACGERDAYGRVLNAVGWCYGRRGETGAATAWHRCEANSNRP